MRKLFILAICTVLFVQCTNKEVQLPQLNQQGLAEMQNHSGIWIFYDASKSGTRAVMNKNNKLQNTHWIFHIDKRLTMGELAPLLNEMQEEHDKDSMHKKEGMLNYFSFADSANQRMALFAFHQTNYRAIDEDSIPELVKGKCLRILTIFEDDLFLDKSRISLTQLDERLSDSLPCPEGSGKELHLSYPQDLSFQRYLEIKADLYDKGISAVEEEWVIRIK